ncbi:MAG: DNA double-strand break repair protein Mre11 [Halobacteriales archaeon]|nr:DNA double-strand break repair protein Mre11 [Halobacteriales archaeon]
MTRVLHTGDTHIGYRQYHSPERRADFLEAFRRVVADAVADEVDAVVHAGDLFHDRRPALADIHGTIEVLRELREAGIPLYAVVGNHERTRGQQWLDLFETLGLATRLGPEPAVVGDVALYGLDFVPRSRRDALEYEFAPHDAAHAALVSHGLFEPFAHADWDTEAVLESATVEFDAMLLGDNHQPGVEEVAGTWVTYCGSTERVDATERDERGYNLVTFDDGVRIARRGIETRPFVTLDLELAPGEGTGRVRDRLREEALADAVVVVSITGDGEPVSPAEVETFAADQGALVARVTDRREFEAADVEAVRFADPDEAVNDRLRSLGLSDAALAIDEVVRDGDVAKTNVRGTVTEHVRELLEDDPAALEPAAEDRPTPETVADSLEAAAEEDEGSDPEPEVAGLPDEDAEDGAADDTPGMDEEAPAATATEATDAEATATDAEPEPADQDGDDGQVTMEDYL